MNVTMYDVMENIIGTPTNDVQGLILYITATVLSVFFVMLIMYVFVLIAKIFRNA